MWDAMNRYYVLGRCVWFAYRCSRSSPRPDLSKTSARYVKYVLVRASIANEGSAFPDPDLLALRRRVGRVIAWGLEAKSASPMAGTSKCEWFLGPVPCETSLRWTLGCPTFW
jgi:hypothetical protein